MAHPSRVATRLGLRAVAGAAVLSVVLAFGPTITVAQSTDVGAYLGFETPTLALGSYGRVATDDGGGLLLRSGAGQDYEYISELADGDVVQIVDGPMYDGDGNGWYLVTDGASTAYAFGGFLTADDELTASSTRNGSGYLGYDTPSFSAGQAVTVVTDDGQGLSIRTGPGTDAEKIATLGDGDVVTVVDGPVYDGSSNGWYLITDGSFQGYGFAGFLTGSASSASSASSSASSSTSTVANPGFDTPAFNAGQTATVQTDDGGALNIRSGPSTESEAALSVPDGSALTVINGPYFDDAQNGWYAVSSGDTSGFVFAAFLTGGSSSTAAPSTSSPGSATPGSASTGYLGYDTPSFSIGQSVKVLTDDGGGLRVRVEAATNGEQVATLGDGDVVTIVSGPWYDAASNGWYQITDGSFTGYAFAGFLTANGSSPASSSASSSSSSSSASSGTARFAAGDDVQVTESVNVRSGASIASSKSGSLNTGVTAEVIDGPFFDTDGDDWYYIRSASLEGFAMGEFLAKATAAASSQSAATAKAFVYPVSGYTFTQAFGCTTYSFEPYNSSLGCNYHNGIDLAVSSYTPIKAAAAGTVTAAGWCDCGLGYYVTIDHGNGYKTTYGHMAEQPYVSVGQTVAQGETIGPVGSTGLSTGPHVHFIVEQNGTDIDPLGVLS
jgi:murein DD-endopeptidase MepM/ murein hydrolase activator NlpD